MRKLTIAWVAMLTALALACGGGGSSDDAPDRSRAVNRKEPWNASALRT